MFSKGKVRIPREVSFELGFSYKNLNRKEKAGTSMNSKLKGTFIHYLIKFFERHSGHWGYQNLHLGKKRWTINLNKHIVKLT